MIDFDFPPLGDTGAGAVMHRGHQGEVLWQSRDPALYVTLQEDRPACAYRCHYRGGSSPCDLATAERFMRWADFYATAAALRKPELGPYIPALSVVRFNYTNWRDEKHSYEVLVEAFQFGPFDPGGVRMDSERQWVLHGNVRLRDGEPRRDAEGHTEQPRRTFVLSAVSDLEVVDDG